MSERDTQFAGFAKLLQDELNEAWRYYRENTASIDYEEYAQGIRQIIARRAYDLVTHILSQTPARANYIHFFMDMTIWPEQERFVEILADLAKIQAKIHTLPEQSEQDG